MWRAIGILIRILLKYKNKKEDCRSKYLNRWNIFILIFRLDMAMLMSFRIKDFGRDSCAMKYWLLLWDFKVIGLKPLSNLHLKNCKLKNKLFLRYGLLLIGLNLSDIYQSKTVLSFRGQGSTKLYFYLFFMDWVFLNFLREEFKFKI